ncbi:hypothetical protein PV407_11955 [Paenibacillus sp. GYB003]
MYHMHQGMELFFLHEGVGKALIENRIIDIESGMLLFYSPFQPHGVTVEHNVPGALIRSVFEFDPIALEPYVKPFSSPQLLFYNLWKNRASYFHIISKSDGNEHIRIFDGQKTEANMQAAYRYDRIHRADRQ